MLIINADDLGRDTTATDTTLACYRRGRISSATGMVFMADSERAAELAKAAGLDVGLHVNFTETFNGRGCPAELLRQQAKIRRFLKRSKYALLLYNPFLIRAFRCVFEAQLKEFTRLYGRAPSHFDGHQHMHLGTNMLLQKIIPEGQKVRRSFSFQRGQKNPVNRAYRRAVDGCLARRHRLTDSFFALAQHLDSDRLAGVLDIARTTNVEVMTHTWNRPEYDLLMSEKFSSLSRGVEMASYAML